MGRSSWLRVVVAVLLLIAPGQAHADYVLLKDGRVVRGRLVSKSSKEVVFQIQKGNSAVTVRYALEDVDRVGVDPPSVSPATRPAPAAPAASEPAPQPTGPTYLVAPIHGTVGLYATGSLLNTYLAIARIEKPDLLILDIDSEGGDVDELAEMLDLLQREKDLPLVAYVHDAYSAAAVLAMACPRIVMAPGASIGAAVPYQRGESGVPAILAEKFQSAIRAKWRSAVSVAGHEPLLVEGMVRVDLVLSRVGSGWDAKIIEGRADAGFVIKPAGRILTMTAQEAVDCGLAAGVSESIEGCDMVLRVPECKERSRAGLGAYARHKKATDDAAKRYATAFAKAREADAVADATNPARFKYLVDPGTRQFTPESRSEWKKRADAHARALGQLETHVKGARNVLRDYPRIGNHPGLAGNALSVAALNEIAKNAAAAADSVRADAKRRGL